MSDDRVEVLKRYAELFKEGRFDLPLDDVDPEVTIDWSESHAPYGGIYRGHAGFQQLFSEIRQSFDEARVEVHEYVVDGPDVAMRNTTHLRGRGDIAVEATSTTVWTFRDGKITEVRLFQEHADALAAMRARRPASRP